MKVASSLHLYPLEKTEAFGHNLLKSLPIKTQAISMNPNKKLKQKTYIYKRGIKSYTL